MSENDTYRINCLLEFAKKISSNFIKLDIPFEAVTLCKKMLKATGVSMYLISEENKNGQRLPFLLLSACIGYDNFNDASIRRKRDYDHLREIKHPIDPNIALSLTAQIALLKQATLVNKREGFSSKRVEYDSLIKKRYNIEVKREFNRGAFQDKFWKDRNKILSFVGVPIVFSDICVGVIKVESKDNRHNESDIKYINLLSAMIAPSIVYNNLNKFIHASTMVFTSRKTDHEIIQGIVNECAKLCNAEACSLFLYEKSLNGLLLRFDYGHDYNLSNNPGSENEFVYKKEAGGKPGVTWECFRSLKEQNADSEKQVINLSGHASKLWRKQWHDLDNKRCTSLFMCPVMDTEFPEDISKKKSIKRYGVLKVENKKDISNYCIDGEGFTEQDKLLTRLFANSIALILRDGLDGKSNSFLPYDMFGESILIKLRSESFKNFTEKYCKQLGPKLDEFAKNMMEKQNKKEHRTIELYSIDVKNIAITIAEDFNCKPFAEQLLTGLRSYEVILDQIPLYRQHFVHQFNVFLLGLVIISENTDIREKLLDKLPRHADLLNIWFLVSMFHDVGLPIEKLTEAFKIFVKGSLQQNKEISFPFVPFSILSIEDYQNIYPKILRALDYVFKEHSELLAISKSTIHNFAYPTGQGMALHNHSLIGACMVGRLLYSTKIIEPANINIILSSILLHEIKISKSISGYLFKKDFPSWHPKLSEAISLNNVPFLYLLGICDTIQNWGRPEEEPLSKAKNIVTLGNIEINQNTIEITLHYNTVPDKEKWINIFNHVIKPQAALWCSPSPTITVYYKRDRGRPLYEEEISVVTFKKVPDTII